MNSKNKIIFTISLSALVGFLIGGVVSFIGVSNYLGKHTADISAQTAANQLIYDVQILGNLESNNNDKAAELLKSNIRQKYDYISTLRHDVSRFTEASVNSAKSVAKNYLDDSLTKTREVE